MGGKSKKKGRQSGGFGSKLERAAFAQEVYQQANNAQRWHRQRTNTMIKNSINNSRQRPRLSGIKHLKELLRERNSYESYELLQRRRRNGFVPQPSAPLLNQQRSKIIYHPPGWILNYPSGASSDFSPSSTATYSKADYVSASNSDMDSTKTPTTTTTHTLENQNSPKQVVEPLHQKCLSVLAEYIEEYLDAMGPEALHGALSLLPSETLSQLSVAISSSPKTCGMTNDLAVALGKHTHIETLCLRASHRQNDENGYEKILDDDGIFQLVPHLPSSSSATSSSVVPSTTAPPPSSSSLTGNDNQLNKIKEEEKDEKNDDDDDEGVLESWEDYYFEDDDDDDKLGDNGTKQYTKHGDGAIMVDILQLEGCNLRLKRLELLDCQSVTAKSVLALLEKCSCITHLSLAGSFPNEDDGIQIFQSLPELLPALQVLDVTRCSWMSATLLDQFVQHPYYSYHRQGINSCFDHANNIHKEENHDDNDNDDDDDDNDDGGRPPPIIYWRDYFDDTTSITAAASSSSFATSIRPNNNW